MGPPLKIGKFPRKPDLTRRMARSSRLHFRFVRIEEMCRETRAALRPADLSRIANAVKAAVSEEHALIAILPVASAS